MPTLAGPAERFNKRRALADPVCEQMYRRRDGASWGNCAEIGLYAAAHVIPISQRPLNLLEC